MARRANPPRPASFHRLKKLHRPAKKWQTGLFATPVVQYVFCPLISISYAQVNKEGEKTKKKKPSPFGSQIFSAPIHHLVLPETQIFLSQACDKSILIIYHVVELIYC